VELPGKESFEGQVIHAADWPRDLTTESLHGKTVVVVGNGCSGVQLVGTLGLDPEINVISLARGAQWFIPSNPGEPRHSVPYTERRIALMNRFPRLQALERWITCAVMDSMWYWYVDKAGAKKRAQMQKVSYWSVGGVW
jgi:cation diffusion facilitator CzcD-associated flavoprotein CzcO